jgi:putative hemolysin
MTMMTNGERESATAGAGLEVVIASGTQEVEAAQRLRYRVFGEELGAELPSRASGLDRDAFDPFCDHLVVRHARSHDVIGTYRILPAERAARAGGFYTATEFDLGRLVELPALVEVGRACVDPRFRNGSVLALLWAGLAAHLRARGYEHVMGCASLPANDVRQAADACASLLREHTCPPEWRVTPHRPLPLEGADPSSHVPLPPLVRGYLRMGATVCGPPAWDPAFRTADIVMVLPMHRLERRFAARLRRAA